MKNVLEVAKWEYSCRVKSKSFIISTILLPLIMVGFIVLPTFLVSSAGQNQKSIAIVDKTHIIGNELKETLENKYKLENDKSKYNIIIIDNERNSKPENFARGLLDSSVVSSYLVIPENIIDKNQAKYYTNNPADFTTKENIRSALNKVLSKQRMIFSNVAPEKIQHILKEVDIKSFKSEKGKPDSISNGLRAYLTPLIFVMMLFFAVFKSSQVLFRSVLEEKKNKLIEILLSSLSPGELMTGKILGLGLVGLTQLGLYLAVGMMISSSSQFNFLNSHIVFLFLLYFLLGYLLYAAIFAAIGSIFDSEQDAQYILRGLSLITILPIILSSWVIMNPNAPMVSFLSYIPILTPFFMILRIGIQSPGFWEIFSTSLLLLSFVIITMYAAGKIFRVALLMYGKRPTPGEIFNWIKD